MRDRADAHLHDVAVMAEELVLEEQLLGDLLRGARGPPRRAVSAALRTHGVRTKATRARGREREGLQERAAPGHDLRAPAREQIELGEVLKRRGPGRRS